jgi:hypothetical protein
MVAEEKATPGAVDRFRGIPHRARNGPAMQPNSEPEFPQTSSADAAPPVSPEAEGLLCRIAEGSRADKRIILDRVLRDLIGDQPDREYTLSNPDGSSYVFLVPPRLRIQFDLTPERVAQLDRNSKSPTRPFSETIAQLERMANNPEFAVPQSPPPDVESSVVSPELEGLLRRIVESSRAEKRTILDRVLRDLIGDQREKEYSLYNPDGTSYVILIPLRLRLQFAHTPEFLAELEQSRRSGISGTLSDLIARLKAMG